MKFLVDAHLPRRLTYRLREAGHEAVHTLDLSTGNRTTDEEIHELSLRANYILITKDADFVNDFILQRRPYKLLLVSTGNITNKELEAIFARNISDIADLFLTHDFIEIDRTSIVIHI